MRFYVGTYSQRGSKGVYVYDLDPKTGALTSLGAAGDVANPSFVALHPSGKFLYAVGEGPMGQVGAFAIDPKSGALQFLNQQSSRGADPCHIAVDPQGKNVLIANYTSGSVGVLPLSSDGRLGAMTAFSQDRDATKIFPGRQDAPHAHFFLTDPSGHYAVACDLGCDKLFVYRYDAGRSDLAPNDPPSVSTHPGAGPRHLAFAPNGRNAYLIHELDATVGVYRYDARHGRFEEKQVISALPPGWKGQNTAAEIVIHPSGKFLYTTNRGNDSIAAFSVENGGDSLRLISVAPSGGKTPRGLDVDPTGSFLVAAHQDSDNLVVHRINRDGSTTPNGTDAMVPAAVCVAFTSGKS